MKEMTNRDARWASRKLRELLHHVARLCEIDAQELMAQSDLQAAEAGQLLRLSDALRLL